MPTFVTRWRTSLGYGVHSPFAYNLITGVLRQRCPYYAYAQLAHTLPWWAWQRRRRARLLFRLANWRQPDTVCAPNASAAELAHLRAGCRRARLVPHPPADLVYERTSQPARATVLFCMGGTQVAVHHPRLQPNTYHLYP